MLYSCHYIFRSLVFQSDCEALLPSLLSYYFVLVRNRQIVSSQLRVISVSSGSSCGLFEASLNCANTHFRLLSAATTPWYCVEAPELSSKALTMLWTRLTPATKSPTDIPKETGMSQDLVHTVARSLSNTDSKLSLHIPDWSSTHRRMYELVRLSHLARRHLQGCISGRSSQLAQWLC